MACTPQRMCFIAIVLLHCVLALGATVGPAGELLPTDSDCCSQTVSIKTELDMLKKVLYSFIQESAAKNMAARQTALETKTGNLEKEIEALKSNEKKQLADLAAQQQLIRNIITTQISIKAQKDLLVTQSQDQASEVIDLKKQVADLLTNQTKLQQRLAEQETVSKQHENKLTSVTSMQVDVVRQVAEQADVNQNQTREQNTFKITQAKLHDKQNLLLKTMANHSFLTSACDTKVDKYKADCEDHIRNTTATLQRQINTFSRHQQNQGLQVKQQASSIKKLSEQGVVQDNKTFAQLKYLSGVCKQLTTDLSKSVEVTHKRLEQDFANHTQQAKRTDDSLKSQLQTVQMQQSILTTELNELESHLNLTYEMLTKKTAGENNGSTLDGKCSDILGFRKGQVLSKRGTTQGAFGRDQLSKTGAFYSMERWINVETLNLYPSEADFINNKNARSYRLPTDCIGAQTQMIGGKLFCPQRNPATVFVYNLANLSKPYKTINITLPGTAAVRSACQYSWGGMSFVDIEVNETGIYILWANANQNCNFVLSRLDPTTLDNDNHWQIPITKTGKGNAFMVCGKLYVTDSHDDSTSFITHVFDTRNNNIVTNPGITYRNEYGYGAHAHYDPTDKVLYVWDRGYQLKVGIVWK